MSSQGLDAMIPETIKHNNAQNFAKLHQSTLFQFDESEPEAWRKNWNYIIDRIGLEETPPRLKMEKDETKSGEEAFFELEMGDVDAKWFLVCHHFGIQEWSLQGLAQKLEEDFYGGNIPLKHPDSQETKSLHEHIQDFLDKYPNGGTQGTECDMTELFTLEEVEDN
ncbi:hypothetical protein [Thiomicrorhabdus indica]|uniref:hypothetical protein n=1 Tax=Thiomicrorhabdus indica TaxID=2267253 RepID=UPI002AA6B30B|nr:hypothetical protein [Thiomicrorhabdus indica]